MPDSLSLLRDLIFGRGRYAREGAPEPTLLPHLLAVASPELLARAALGGDLFHVAELHPELRADLVSAIASRLVELPAPDRAAFLEREPALIEYLPKRLLPEAARVAETTHDAALGALVRLKMAGRTGADPNATLAAVRSLLGSGRGATPWRYSALLDLAVHTKGAERIALIDELARMPDFAAQADFVAGIAKLLPSKERSEFLLLWLRDAPPMREQLGPEWECWALTRVAPQLSEKEYAGALQGALQAADRLQVPWQRAEAIRQLRRALDSPGVDEGVRVELGHHLHDLVPADEPWQAHLHRYVEDWLKKRKPKDQPAPSAQVYAHELRELLAATPPKQVQQVLGDGLGAALGRWSGHMAAARPPMPHSPPPPPAPPGAIVDRDADVSVPSDEFDLGAGRSSPTRARRPRARLAAKIQPPPRRVVSTGFAEPATRGEPRDNHLPLEPRAPYYYWLEVGEPVAGAVDTTITSLPKPVPRDAELVVALFAPQGGFAVSPEHVLGRLRLSLDGTARVLAQPADQYEGVPADLLERRLLFPVRAPIEPGQHRLRSNIYCQGVLVQSRLVEAYVGKAPPRRKPAVVSNVDYTLSDTLSPSALGEVESHELSVMLNRNANGSHDFYFYAGKGAKPFHGPATISADTLDGVIAQARLAMRKVSWDDVGEWAPGKPNRYQQPATLDRLRVDLTLLAARGYDIYDTVAENLAGDAQVTDLEDALKSPGLLQIAGKEDIRFVLPAAIIYDYDLDNQKRPLDKYDLCPTFADAFRQKTKLLTTACFRGACPSRGNNTVICPSGFWGFRHAIGLPISLGKARAAQGKAPVTDLASRLRYRDVPVMVVAVSTAPDLTEREGHERDIRALRQEWSQRGWLRGSTRDQVLDLMASGKPHLVYFYCHGGVTDRDGKKTPYLSVGAPSEKYIIRSNLRASHVRWDEPRPLVFINGCHTTALDADTALDFVTGFVQQAQACGVIGTEITVFESLACDFATGFWRLFLSGEFGIGESIRQARLELLQAGNPLGLVYTPFVLAGTKLEKVS
ncbi:MAG: hypothetical protein HY700_02120 [Gemmatimonadetes bacterium]|nr:hypothetical protein [Gemmatimonadota bacterium]